MLPSKLHLAITLSLLAFSQIVIAVLVNRTIDDTYGDLVTGEQVQYLPAHSPDDESDPYWKNVAECATPDACAINPPVSLAFNNTYTSTTYFPNTDIGNNISAGFTFNGTAIYIYLILSNEPANTSLVSNVNMDFRLDGQIVGSFSHITDGSGSFQFNVLGYNASALELQNHTMLLETTGSQSSFDMFDYAIYTTDTEEVSTPSQPSTPTASQPSTPGASQPSTQSQQTSDDHKKLNLGAVLGGLFGGLAALTVAIVLAILLWRRRRAAQRELHLASQISRLQTGEISNLGNYNAGIRMSEAGSSLAQYGDTSVSGSTTTVANKIILSAPQSAPPRRSGFQKSRTFSRSNRGEVQSDHGMSSASDSPVVEDLPPAYSPIR